MGEEESDVDIEGYEEDDDGKPKTPAPVMISCKKHGNLSPLFPLIVWFNELIIVDKMNICIKQ